MGLKENIKMRRLAMGMTLEQVAKAVGVSGDAPALRERGYLKHPRRKIELLARALGTTPSTLMGWDNGDSDGELTEYLEQLKTVRDAHAFQAGKNASKTDVEKAVRIIEALKSTGRVTEKSDGRHFRKRNRRVPGEVEAVTVTDANGDYNIYLNRRLPECRRRRRAPRAFAYFAWAF